MTLGPGIPWAVLVVAWGPSTVISLSRPGLDLPPRAGKRTGGTEGKCALRTKPPSLLQAGIQLPLEDVGILWGH